MRTIRVVSHQPADEFEFEVANDATQAEIQRLAVDWITTRSVIYELFESPPPRKRAKRKRSRN